MPMTRIAYDGITPSKLPADGDIYLSYIDGQWPNFGQLAGLFPGKIHVPIAVDPAHDATVLDCETGDATPAQCPAWAVRQWNRGQIPTVYCNGSTWGSVIDAFNAARVGQPEYWIADYDHGPVIIPGSVAKQYRNTPGFDLSIVLDYWPGVDPPPPVPPPPHPAPPILTEEDMYNLPHIAVKASAPQGGVLLFPSGLVMVLADETAAAYKNQGCPIVPYGDAQFANLLAHVTVPGA